jgi:hypothetical protein
MPVSCAIAMGRRRMQPQGSASYEIDFSTRVTDNAAKRAFFSLHVY